MALRLSICSRLVAGCLLGVLAIAPAARAQPLTLEFNGLNITFPPGTGGEPPPRTDSTGTRGPLCGGEFDPGAERERQPLTAIAPPNNIATTLSPHPTLYAYIPETQGKNLEFAVFDVARNEVIYEAILPPNPSAGVLAFTLPETVTLEPEQVYEWGAFVVCNPWDRSREPAAVGWLWRVRNPELAAQARATAEPLARAALYAEAGIWSEMLDNLRPAGNSLTWQRLFESVGLPEFATTPVID